MPHAAFEILPEFEVPALTRKCRVAPLSSLSAGLKGWEAIKTTPSALPAFSQTSGVDYTTGQTNRGSRARLTSHHGPRPLSTVQHAAARGSGSHARGRTERTQV